MRFVSSILSLATLLGAVVVQADLKNTTQEYYLKTKLKDGQSGKERYDGLYVQSYHTGAGLSDATLTKKENGAAAGFLNGTNGKSGSITYRNQVFDLGNDFAWSLVPDITDTFYTAWQPVRINAGGGGNRPRGGSGFWFNSTGLQWTSAPNQKPGGTGNEFGGWLVCNWWHQNAVQLFFRMKYYNPSPIPNSCADVYLVLEYI